jgi:hypothetical protein
MLCAGWDDRRMASLPSHPQEPQRQHGAVNCALGVSALPTAHGTPRYMVISPTRTRVHARTELTRAHTPTIYS